MIRRMILYIYHTNLSIPTIMDADDVNKLYKHIIQYYNSLK